MQVSTSESRDKLAYSMLSEAETQQKLSLLVIFRRRGMKASVATTGGLSPLRSATESSLA